MKNVITYTIEPIKVLYVLNSLGRGGIESFVTGIYNKIDRSKIQFDFCICQGKETDHRIGCNL